MPPEIKDDLQAELKRLRKENAVLRNGGAKNKLKQPRHGLITCRKYMVNICCLKDDTLQPDLA